MTDDDRSRGATTNQAGNCERGCPNAKKFHANLTSCPLAKLRFNVVAAVLGCGMAGHVRSAMGYAQHRSRSYDAVLRVYDAVGDVIATHEHKGEFKEW